MIFLNEGEILFNKQQIFVSNILFFGFNDPKDQGQKLGYSVRVKTGTC